MGRYDFKFGWNEPVAPPNDVPTYAPPVPPVEPVNDNSPCMGRITCAVCGKFHGYCSEAKLVHQGLQEIARQKLTGVEDDTGNIINKAGIPYSQWEKNPMDLGTHYDKESKSGGGGKFKRRPFLKAKDIAAKGSSAKIQDFREAPKAMEYSDFLVDVAIGKKEFTWGLKTKSVTLNMLIDALGKRTEKWIGKTVKLVRGGPKGQYVNLGN